MNLSSRLVPLLLIVFFQTHLIFAQADSITIISGINSEGYFQLDTSGLGGDVQAVAEIFTQASDIIDQVSIDADYRLKYTTTNVSFPTCCVDVNLDGNNASRRYIFSFLVTNFPSLELEYFIVKGETRQVDLPVANEADSIFTNLTLLSEKYADIEYTGSSQRTHHFEFTGKRHGVEEVLLQMCTTDGKFCEFKKITVNVFDQGKFQLPAQIDTTIDNCYGVYHSYCMPTLRADFQAFDWEIKADGIDYQTTIDTCGAQVDMVKYTFGQLFWNSPRPFEVLSWEVNNDTYSGFVFHHYPKVLQWMDYLLADRSWTTRSWGIEGATDGDTFGDMVVVDLITRDTLIVQPELKTGWVDYAFLNLPHGEYDFAVEFPDFDFEMNSQIKINCSNFDGLQHVYDTIEVNESKTDFLWSPNIRYPVTNPAYSPPGNGNNVEFTYNPSNQVLEYRGAMAGSDEFVVEFCNALNLCDTFYYHVEVLPLSTIGITVTVPPEADKVIYCPRQPFFQPIEAISDCQLSTDVNIGFRDSMVVSNCISNRIDYRIWILTDRCGNRLELTQKIESIDDEGPTLLQAPNDLVITCHEPIPMTEPVWEDNCGFIVYDSYDDAQSLDNCPNVTIYRTWTARDVCDNTSTYVQKIERENEGPFLMHPSLPVIDLQCGDTTTYDPPEFTHECGLDFTVDFTETVTNTDCSNREILRIWTATDECGEMTTDEQSLIYMDFEPPMFDAPLPQSVTIDQTAGEPIPPVWQPTATDNCGDVTNIEFEEYIGSSFSLPEIISMNRHYDAFDECDNIQTHIHHITIKVDPVWPGDTDDDGDVDGEDLFPIGFAFGTNGPVRPNGDMVFRAQPSLNWGRTNGRVDFKYSDTDASGDIDFIDTFAIHNNWGMIHPKAPETKPIGIVENLRAELAFVNPNGWAAFDLLLGSDAAVIEDFYGISFDLLYDSDLINKDSAYVDYSGSWAGQVNNDLIAIQRNFLSEKTYRTAIVRNDGAGITDVGKIGRFYLKVRLPLPPTLSINIPEAKGIYLDGEEFTSTAFAETFNLTSATATVFDESLFELSPNPTTDKVVLDFHQSLRNARVQVTDLLGKEVKQLTVNGQQKMELSLGHLPKGTYLIKVKSGDSHKVERVVVQ